MAAWLAPSEPPQAEPVASLVGSQLAGMAFVRYVLRLEPLASADHDTLIACVAPTLQRYFTGDLQGRQWAGQGSIAQGAAGNGDRREPRPRDESGRSS